MDCMTGELHVIAEVSAASGPSIVDLLEVVGAFVVGAPLGVLLAKFYLRLTTPARAGNRAPRRGRAALPAAVSPAAAGTSPEVDA